MNAIFLVFYRYYITIRVTMELVFITLRRSKDHAFPEHTLVDSSQTQTWARMSHASGKASFRSVIVQELKHHFQPGETAVMLPKMLQMQQTHVVLESTVDVSGCKPKLVLETQWIYQAMRFFNLHCTYYLEEQPHIQGGNKQRWHDTGKSPTTFTAKWFLKLFDPSVIWK